jgi:hypothetical protein
MAFAAEDIFHQLPGRQYHRHAQDFRATEFASHPPRLGGFMPDCAPFNSSQPPGMHSIHQPCLISQPARGNTHLSANSLPFGCFDQLGGPSTVRTDCQISGNWMTFAHLWD